MTEAAPFAKVGIVGTGRVASALGMLLAEQSSAPVVVWGRTPAHSDRLASDLGKAEAAPDLGALHACDLVMIAVADDAMGEVSELLAAAGPFPNSALVFHVSGRSGTAILDPLARLGALTAAVHPVMTFTGDAAVDMPNVAGAHFAVTAIESAALEQGHRLVSLLGGVAVEIAEEDRSLYHAALCHAANHLVTLIAQASAMLESASVPDPAATFAPLVRAALANSLDQGFAALSGPLLRGDVNTIRSHLAAIEKDCPEVLPAYRALALATLDNLEREGKPTPLEMKDIFG